MHQPPVLVVMAMGVATELICKTHSGQQPDIWTGYRTLCRQSDSFLFLQHLLKEWNQPESPKSKFAPNELGRVCRGWQDKGQWDRT